MGAYHQGVTHLFDRCRLLLVGAAAGLGLAGLLAATPQTSSHDYVLHSGDQVAISVFGDQTLSQNVVVLSDGSVVYPLVGKIKLGGYTLDAATSRITNALRKYVRDPMVTLNVTQQGTDSVLVLGNVKTPGKYSLPSTARIADAIAAAGGIGDSNGDYPAARVSINNGPVATVSLQALLRNGNFEDNVLLGSDTMVYVTGPAPMNVEVLGSVDHPGSVPVYSGDRLSIAIAKAGNTANSHADLSHIHVSRTAPDGTTQTSTYNLYNALERGDLSADPVLQKSDVVYVPEAHQSDKTSTVFQGIFAVLSRLIFPF
jgi:polysaccharide export outer membrane protein